MSVHDKVNVSAFNMTWMLKIWTSRFNALFDESYLTYHIIIAYIKYKNIDCVKLVKIVQSTLKFHF